MTTQYNFDQYRQDATNILKTHGIRVRWGHDFTSFKRIVARQPDRPAPAPGFDPTSETTDKVDGIWLAAYDQTGELIHTQATRLMNIAPNMAEHLATRGDCYEPAYWKFDSQRSKLMLTPAASAITGPAVYHGENWVKGGRNGYRGGPYVYLFCRMMMAAAIERWQPPHIYGFVTPGNAARGLPQRVGYHRCEQGTLEFQQDDGAAPVELWMVWMTLEEALCNLRLPPEYFAETFGAPDLPKAA